MNQYQKRVLKTQWRENCYILMSPKIRDSDHPMDIDNMDYAVSFLYHNPETGYAAEWEPCYGPIQVWHQCLANSPDAKEHYFFDFTDSQGGNWSQLSVEREGLHLYFFDSDWNSIFNVLMSWTDR